MNNIHISEAQIHDEYYGTATVLVLWRVFGIEHTWYPTKIAAEVAARSRFPDEDPNKRYARLSCANFFRDNN